MKKTIQLHQGTHRSGRKGKTTHIVKNKTGY